MLALVGVVLTAQTAFATNSAVTVLNNGTLVPNKIPSWNIQYNSTGNLTDPPNAKTNEHDYNVGKSLAIRVYSCRFIDGSSCDTSGNDTMECGQTHDGTGWTWLGHVTNTTACYDGFVAGWIHWCKTNVKHCIEQITYGTFTGSPRLAHMPATDYD